MQDHPAEINHVGPVPVYLQLAALIRRQIEDGTLRPDRPIPSIRTLAQEHDLALNTVKRALDLLRQEGLIVNVPGRGSYVTRRRS